MRVQTKRLNKKKLEEAGEILKRGAEDFVKRAAEIRETKSNRGGARLGSGRPKGSTKEEEAATERLMFRLTPSQLEALETQAVEGESAAQTARRILLQALGLKR